MGNLEAILGYQGARATGDAVEVAPDIIAMPFWTPEFCATVRCHWGRWRTRV